MKPFYRIELHAHTKETSLCARVPADELVERYLAKGYDGIVITDHMSHGTLKQFEPTQNWNAAVDHFLTGYRAVKAAAADRIKVYLGMEVRSHGFETDYLVYGFDEQFLRENPFPYQLPIKSFYDLCKSWASNIQVFLAHPFRYGIMIPGPDCFDGIEIFNNHPKNNSQNPFAALWASQYQKPVISGSDFHRVGDEGRGGVLLPFLPEDEKALAGALMTQNKLLLRSN